jgi:hypothetical protein
MATQYVYLLKEREFVKTNENIYKIGKTRQHNNKRFFAYPKDSILLFQILCDDCDKLENDIIKVFKKKYNQCKNIGIEYFEGDCNDMIDTIFYLKKNMYDDVNKMNENLEKNKIKLINLNNENEKRSLINLEERERNKLIKYINNIINTDFKKIICMEKKERNNIERNNIERNISESEIFFLKYFKKITLLNDENFISIRDFLCKFKLSNEYLTKTENSKKLITLKSMINFFEKNDETKKYYRKLHRPYINGKQKNFSNVLIGHYFA